MPSLSHLSVVAPDILCPRVHLNDTMLAYDVAELNLEPLTRGANWEQCTTGQIQNSNQIRTIEKRS